MKLAGMASDRGRSLLHVADQRPGDAEVAVVLGEDPDAPVLAGAVERGIPTEVVGDGGVADALAGHDADLLVVDGYDQRLDEAALETVPTAVAVHRSLLPAFPGRDPVGDAVTEGVRTTGATLAVVTPGDGHGPVVTQEPVPVYEDDDEAAVAERVVGQAGVRALARAVRWFAEGRVTVDGETVRVDGDDGGALPGRYLAGADRAADLRYGENPHQDAAVYADRTDTAASVVGADQLNEGAKALSYNNYNDADAALGLVREFDDPAAAVIKHTNPAGCAVGDSVAEAYDRALSTDAKSAFGGIVALNRECDRATAEAVTDSFKEVVVAPGYTDGALDALFEKDNLRVLAVGSLEEPAGRVTEKHLAGGRLLQERDRQRPTADDLEVVTDREPSDEQVETMLFAWQTVKHVKSNAILFATGTETVGVGAGQVSRVDAVEIAAKKAGRDAEGKSADGAVMASDAFFPFPDGVEAAAEAGVEAVIQPGGSVNDDDVVAACDDLGLAMAFTGQRAFRHD
jgi:phosphoribosylaminoimidazolecarboxamide formyltransferase